MNREQHIQERAKNNRLIESIDNYIIDLEAEIEVNVSCWNGLVKRKQELMQRNKYIDEVLEDER